MPKQLVWMLILCSGAACAAQTRQPPSGMSPAQSMLVRRRLWSVVDTLVLDRAAAIARYGPPLSVSGDTVRPQATPDVLDSAFTIRFRHHEAYYHVYRGGRTELWHVTIAVPGTSVPPQVAPGASRQSLVAYLGEPDTESDEPEGLLLLYSLCGADEDCNVFNILLVEGRVRWISWVFFPNEPSWLPR